MSVEELRQLIAIEQHLRREDPAFVARFDRQLRRERRISMVRAVWAWHGVIAMTVLAVGLLATAVAFASAPVGAAALAAGVVACCFAGERPLPAQTRAPQRVTASRRR